MKAPNSHIKIINDTWMLNAMAQEYFRYSVEDKMGVSFRPDAQFGGLCWTSLIKRHAALSRYYPASAIRSVFDIMEEADDSLFLWVPKVEKIYGNAIDFLEDPEFTTEVLYDKYIAQNEGEDGIILSFDNPEIVYVEDFGIPNHGMVFARPRGFKYLCPLPNLLYTFPPVPGFSQDAESYSIHLTNGDLHAKASAMRTHISRQPLWLPKMRGAR